MYNEKEKGILKDLKNDESLCVEKYQKYTSRATSPELQDLLSRMERQESEHLQTISKLIDGDIPVVTNSSTPSPAAKAVSDFCPAPTNYNANPQAYESDKYLCTDALSTEKHVSAVYDTSIFEFRNKNVRDTLNHIQKEEQEHGEKIYGFMAQNGMYN